MPRRSCDWQVHMSLINKNGETHSHLLNAFGFVGNILQNTESMHRRQRTYGQQLGAEAETASLTLSPPMSSSVSRCQHRGGTAGMRAGDP